jgi:hypothetical protein
VLADPEAPETIGRAILEAMASADGLRARGLARAGEFTWAQTAKSTLEVYREVHAMRSGR